MNRRQIVVSFEHWSIPMDSIILGFQRRSIKQLKDKLQKWWEQVDIDEFRLSCVALSL